MQPYANCTCIIGISLKKLCVSLLRPFENVLVNSSCIIAVNTRIYNLISVLQITYFLLEDAIVSSKAKPCSGSMKQKRSNG